jgi:hypothetical protein
MIDDCATVDAYSSLHLILHNLMLSELSQLGSISTESSSAQRPKEQVTEQGAARGRAAPYCDFSITRENSNSQL